MPTSAKAIPTRLQAARSLPAREADDDGISGAVAEIGATTPIRPIASPW